MNGPTAQLVALACHFNGSAGGLHNHSFFPSNSTCTFCEYVHFTRRRRGWFGQPEKWEVAAQTPDDWLNREVQPGRRATISHHSTDNPRISDRMSAGIIGGGGHWQLNLVADGRTSVWNASWEIGNRDAANQRIWRVTYALIDDNDDPALATSESPESLIPKLKETLSNILIFAEHHGIGNYATLFGKAIECLSADDPFALVYHKDLSPDGLLSL
jgi:hypothetical protein